MGKLYIKICGVLLSLFIIISLTGCNTNNSKVPTSNQATSSPVATIVSDNTSDEAEDNIEEVDSVVLDKLVGIWEVKSVNYTKNINKIQIQYSPEILQAGIFTDIGEDCIEFLMFEKSGDMFYFHSGLNRDTFGTFGITDEKRLYEIVDNNTIEINAQCIKVKYKFDVKDDELRLENDKLCVDLIRDYEIKGYKYVELNKLIADQKNNWGRGKNWF